MRKIFGIYICIIVLSLSIKANAESISKQYNYEAYWGGFKVGALRLTDTETDNSYNIIASINSKGIAKIVSNYSSINIASGAKSADKYHPKLYNCKWWRKKEAQDIQLGFSAKGDIATQSLIPPERVGKRPDVAEKNKKNVVDPVTAAFVSRETIRQEIKKNPNSTATFAIPTYDGKRRFDVMCTIKGYKNIDIGGKMQNLLHITMRRNPIGGFREKDLVEMRDENIDFYLNADFIPVWGSAKAQMGSATIKLIE